MDKPKEPDPARDPDKQGEGLPAQQTEVVPAAGKSAARPSEAERIRAVVEENPKAAEAPKPSGKDSF